jgi:hypothetical protein
MTTSRDHDPVVIGERCRGIKRPHFLLVPKGLPLGRDGR